MTERKSYKQPVKEESRRIIWQNAVRSLTQNRMQSRVINPNYMDRLWDYCRNNLSQMEYAPDIHTAEFEGWKHYGEILKGTKHANELKVAFFCGPEPENDVDHLLELGVRLENIYAFEYDRDIFETAVESLQSSYPSLKIFNGKIETYVALHQTKFDIIYLDFTRSLITEFRTIAKILDANALSDLGVLVVNTTYPDASDENIKFLAEYFLWRSWVEYPVIYGKDETDSEAEDEHCAVESCTAHGIWNEDELIPIIREHFDEAYSAFQTNFVATYSNLIKPINAVLNNEILRHRVFTSDEQIREILGDKERISQMEVDYTGDATLLCTAFSQITNSIWHHFFNTKDAGSFFTRQESIRMLELFLYAGYEKFLDLLSDRLQQEISAIGETFIEKQAGVRKIFCDLPMIHLWLELMIMQMGYPYHHNTAMHKRYAYTAKTRQMCIDIFTLDTCRELYDSLPMMEYYSWDMQDANRQMLIRMCMDAIAKQNHWQLDQMYLGAHLVGINEFFWSKHHSLKGRIVIKNEQ